VFHHILQAAENFCIHQLGSSSQKLETLPKTRTLIACLNIETSDAQRFHTYIGCDEPLLQTIIEIFLGEDISEMETLSDMLLETTNMIIGSAKVLAGQTDSPHFTISIPHLCKDNYETISPDFFATLLILGGEMSIAIKSEQA
jgi:hypothetical protein